MLSRYETYDNPGDDGKGGIGRIFLKRLTACEMLDADEALTDGEPRPGTRAMKIFGYGVAGWENVKGEREGELVFQDDKIDWIPYPKRYGIIQRICEISSLPGGMSDELINVVRTAHLKSEAGDSKTWDCERCQEKGYDSRRNCTLPEKDRIKLLVKKEAMPEKHLAPWNKQNKKKGKPVSKTMKLGGHGFKNCPIGATTRRAWVMFSIVQDCKEGQALPFTGGLLEQPYWFYQAKRVVDTEINKVTSNKKNVDRSDSVEPQPDASARIQSRVRKGRRTISVPVGRR